MQKLTRRVATLNRFISKSSKRCKLFYDVLRKNKSFGWTSQHEKAFQNLKTYMMTPPLLLTNPKNKEELQVYLAVAIATISAVLVREDDVTQSPIYYVSKTLVDAETRYTSQEKLILALVMTFTKLRAYFECHSICVKTNYPIRSIMN